MEMTAIAQAQKPGLWKKDIAYGDQPLQRLDIYRPDGAGPFPYIIQIHGGGWWNGDKQWQSAAEINRVLQAGCVYIAINYRFLPEAKKENVFPPVLLPFNDARRALQFVRAHAAEWNLAPEAAALTGGSAGACTALWLALSPDLADARASAPLDRVSTRVMAVGVRDAQTSLDPVQMREWVGPDLKYGGHAFGLPEADFESFLQRRSEFEPYFSTLSPAALLRGGNPPVFLSYGKGLDEPKKDSMYHVHSPLFGVGFQKEARKKGVICYLACPGLPSEGPPVDMMDFLIATITKAQGSK